MTTPDTTRDLPLWLRPWAVALFVLVLVVIRLFVSAHTNLVRDEAYYTAWSFWPQLGYYDHPPMVAWFVALGRLIAGENELGVRLVPVLATGLTSLAVYRTGRTLLDARTAGLAVIWFNATVAAGLLFIAAPDAPAILFWSLSVWATAEFVARRNPYWWLATGLFAGLALLSKYTAGFLGLGLLLFLVTSRERIVWLKLWQVWAGAALALLVLAPNLIWNAQNEWVSIAFQAQRLDGYGLTFGSFWANFGDFLGGQALATGLFLFLFILIGVVSFFIRVEIPDRANLALPIFVGAPVLLYFGYTCINLRVEANWPMVAWPMLSLAGAWAAVHIRPRNLFAAIPLGVFRWAQAPLNLALVALIYVQAVWQPWSLPQVIDRTRDMRGWADAYAQAAALADAQKAGWIGVVGTYGLNAEIMVYARFAGDTRPVLPLGDVARFRFVPSVDPSVTNGPGLALAGWSLETGNTPFETTSKIGAVERRQRDEVLERFDAYAVTGLRDR